MAFGTFMKKIWNGAKNLAQKAAPIIRKGLDVVSKIAPAAASIAGALGRPDIAAGIGVGGAIAGQAGQAYDNIRGTVAGPPNRTTAVVGAHGHGQRNFDRPLPKNID